MFHRRIDIHRGWRIGVIAAAALTVGVGGTAFAAPASAHAPQQGIDASTVRFGVANLLCGTTTTPSRRQYSDAVYDVSGAAWHLSPDAVRQGTSIAKQTMRCAPPPKPVIKPAAKPKATPKTTVKKAAVKQTAKKTVKTTTSSSSSQTKVQGSSVSGEPCHSTVYYTGTISAWKVPPGCYAGIYSVNTRNYVYRSGFGWCTWWPEVLHPSTPNILHETRHSAPRAGAAVYFAPGVQGASSSGHYAEVVAVLPKGWVLISEMNDEWRGGGFGRVNYRYIHTGSGVYFMY